MKNMFNFLIFCSLTCLLAGCGEGDSGDSDGRPPFLLLNISKDQVVGSTAGSFDLWVTSNTSWTVTTETSWIHPETEGDSGNKTVTIAYDGSEANSRSGVVKFSAEGVKTVELKVTQQTGSTFSNPVFQMADPWIVKYGNTYYTCKAQGNGINMSQSSKLSVINGTRTVWTPTAGAWNRSNIWAPELHYVDGRWYIYYAAGVQPEGSTSYRNQRTGVLRARTEDPMGAWEDMGMIYTGTNYTVGITPTLENTIYAIDMGVFKLNGQLYAVWSGSDSQSSAGNDKLFIATMSNPWTINSNRVEISRAEYNWERQGGNVNEGAAFLHNEAAGKFFIIYSASQSTTKYYTLGCLTLDTTKDPMVKGNWVKSSLPVFYRNDDVAANGVNGVGHNCFTKSPDETEDWIVYHVKSGNAGGWDGRYTFMQKFTWNADGTPNFGTPVGWGEKIPVPSGEY